MKVHLFRAASSPGCASYGLTYMTSQEKEAHPSAAQFILHDFHVDDGLISVKSAHFNFRRNRKQTAVTSIIHRQFVFYSF